MKHARPEPAVFGQFLGQPVHQVTLGRPGGLQAQIITWGAVLRDLSLPLAGGTRLPLTLGFDTFAPYPAHSPYFGAIVGRYANRIAGGRFTQGGRIHHLDRNEARKTTLHGGKNGFARRLWQIADLTDDSVTLCLTSTDGDQGFPGTLAACCTYTVTENRLEVQFFAKTDQPTPVNLSQHAYFNLDGGPDLRDHDLQIFADAYTPVGPDQVPTGQILPVDDTSFDFRQPRLLRQMQSTFDHNFVLSSRPSETNALRPAARLASHKTGISMLVQTTKPGLQLYDGHLLNVPVPGHGGRTYGRCAGLCLEAQYYPDSPNQPGFPDSILLPGHDYAHLSIFSFERHVAPSLAVSGRLLTLD
jgi:aldose 1-epimerase